MTSISRREFRQIFSAGIQLDDKHMEQRLRAAGADPALLTRANLNHDGVVAGTTELNALYREVERLDKNGWFLSIDPRGAGGDLFHALQAGPPRVGRPLEKHIDVFQRVLRTHLEGATLVDDNGNGQLDPTDVVWTRDDKGGARARRIGEALCDRVKVGAAMVLACEDMAQARHAFALIKDHRFASSHWQSEGGGTFRVRHGVRPSQALRDVFARPAEYRFECATALVLVHYRAMLELVGDDDFDRICPRLRIGPWQTDGTLERHVRTDGDPMKEASADRKKTLRAGDYAYIKNWDVSERGAAAGWQGENVIALGDGRLYGHPFGIASEEHIVSYLNTHRSPGAGRSAAMLDMQMELSESILAEDLLPG